MLLKKCKEFRSLDLLFGQFIVRETDHSDAINICKEMMLMPMSKLFAKVFFDP